jgi:hypothetical protein
MMKTILATILAAAFLISVPVQAQEKAGEPPADKAEKGKKDKKDKKADGKAEGKKDEKPAGGGW